MCQVYILTSTADLESRPRLYSSCIGFEIIRLSIRWISNVHRYRIASRVCVCVRGVFQNEKSACSNKKRNSANKINSTKKFIAIHWKHVLLIFFNRIGRNLNSYIFFSWKLSATGAVATILFSNTHTHTYHYCVYLLPLYLLFTRTLDVFFAFNFALSLSRSLILCVSQSHAGRLHCSNRNNAFVYICKFRAMHVLYVQPTYMAIALWTIADMHLYVCRWNCTRLFIVQSPIAKHLFRKLHKRRKKNRINRTLCVESEWVSEWVFVYVTVCARSWEYVEFKIYV